LKIAFFVYEYPPAIVGGLGTYAQYITQEMVRQGHDVSVYTMNPGNKYDTREVVRGVEVHRPMGVDATNVFPLMVAEGLRQWGHFFNDIFIYNLLSATKFVNQQLRIQKEEFHIVCVHDWLSAIAGLAIKNSTSLPVVAHIHSTEWGRRRDDGSPFIQALEWELAWQADRVITVSEAMKDDLSRHNWPSAKISVVWNGVDPEVYSPERVSAEEAKAVRERYGVGPEETMLFFIGRLTWVKGVRNLVQAMPEVLREYPRTKLVILGKGEEQRDVMEMASRLNIADSVITRFDFVSEKERIAHYAAADICIFPSTYEPFGIVSLEAMAMEKPLVVGARGVVGFREQVVPAGPEQTGIHANGNDPMDIAWGIKVLLSKPQAAREMGRHGRERVLRHFTWRQVAKQTIEIYESLVQEKAMMLAAS